MPVPTSGSFNMFGTANTTIQGAIVEGGGNASGATDFIALRNLATVSRFDPTYAGNITSLSQVTSSNQFRGYPISISGLLRVTVITATDRSGRILLTQNGSNLAGQSTSSQNCSFNENQSIVTYAAGLLTVAVRLSNTSGNAGSSLIELNIYRDDNVNMASQTYTHTGSTAFNASFSFTCEANRQYWVVGWFVENDCPT